MAFEIDHEELKDKGFVFNNEDNIIVNFKKKINDRNDLVFELSPEPSLYLWCKDEDYEDENMDGVRVYLHPESVDEAILIAEKIVYVDYTGF
ncbi:hypothetical protein EGI16_21770 [Chryseobacterium sp. G0240]|uniref:hypothetical protein n=1 Tax=Chryseobacterium sp. G0240 TaxID=2487066 RepID=UPI000F4579B7|nr:hypothetical protein [Chryseobacterium sp. G0240]ROH98309.1 hypothetical protein EGI16_21770 [Chryseobacterium sp. G0240]